MLSEPELEQYFSSSLGCKISLCICQEEIGIDDLASAERLRLEGIKHRLKRSAWLRGRKALKTLILRTLFEPNSDIASGLESTILARSSLCSRASISVTTALIPTVTTNADADQMPTEKLCSEPRQLPKNLIDTTLLLIPNPSLSLSHSGALAIAVLCLDDAVGVGIDLEMARPVMEGSTRFFLSEAERAWFFEIDSAKRNNELLRLWTVKESLFKSDLQNKGKTLIEYSVEDPPALHGTARTAGGSRFRYSSCKINDYWLSVAIRTKEKTL